MKKNVASQVIGAQMVSATDGSAFTGSVTVSVTGDGGTQATGSVGSGACTHEGNGFHTYAPAQAETNYDHVAFTFTGTGAIPATVQVYTLPTTGILAPTTAGRTLDVSAGGEAGLDWSNIGSPTTSVNLSGTSVKTATDVETDTQDLQTKLGVPANLGSGATFANNLADIAAQTDDIGAAGAGLTAIPWNAAWDAEVQSECTDALNAYDPPTKAEMDTAIDAVPTATENADALLNRDMSAVSDTNARSPLNALRFLRNKWSTSGGTLTVTKEDDSTSAWTSTITGDASADRIVGSDPA